MEEKTEENLSVRFKRTISHNGYAYAVSNNEIIATSIEDYTIAIIGLDSNAKLYTKRSMTENSLIEAEGEGYVELPLPRIAGTATNRPTNIEAQGSLDFPLFVDKDEDEITREVLGQVDIVLQKDGVEVDRATLPPY